MFESTLRKSLREPPLAAKDAEERKICTKKKEKKAEKSTASAAVIGAINPKEKTTVNRSPKLGRAPMMLRRLHPLHSAAPANALPPVPSRKAPGVGNEQRLKRTGRPCRRRPVLHLRLGQKGYACHSRAIPPVSFGQRAITANGQLPPSATAPLPPPDWFYTFLKRLSRSCSPARPCPLVGCRPVF